MLVGEDVALDGGEHAGGGVGDDRAVVALVGQGDATQLVQGEDLGAGDATASSSPWPLMTSTPVDFEWGTASCPAAFRSVTTCDPISPVPPMTAIFIGRLS